MVCCETASYSQAFSRGGSANSCENLSCEVPRPTGCGDIDTRQNLSVPCPVQAAVVATSTAMEPNPGIFFHRMSVSSCCIAFGDVLHRGAASLVERPCRVRKRHRHRESRSTGKAVPSMAIVRSALSLVQFHWHLRAAPPSPPPHTLHSGPELPWENRPGNEGRSISCHQNDQHSGEVAEGDQYVPQRIIPVPIRVRPVPHPVKKRGIVCLAELCALFGDEQMRALCAVC